MSYKFSHSPSSLLVTSIQFIPSLCPWLWAFADTKRGQETTTNLLYGKLPRQATSRRRNTRTSFIVQLRIIRWWLKPRLPVWLRRCGMERYSVNSRFGNCITLWSGLLKKEGSMTQEIAKSKWLLVIRRYGVDFLKFTSSCAHQTLHNKNEILVHPSDHGNAHFGRTQQPTNNPAALA